MSNQAPKAIEWNVDEEVVKAAVPDAICAQKGYMQGEVHIVAHSLDRTGEGKYMTGGYPQEMERWAWAQARLYPEVARLDAARDEVLAKWGKNASWDAQNGDIIASGVNGYYEPVGHGFPESSAWFDAASGIASAPSLEDAQMYGSACCNSIGTEHHPNCPVRSVEACDQPVVPRMSDVELKSYASLDTLSSSQDEALATMAKEIIRLRSQSHPSLQESGPSVFVTSYIAGDKSSVLCRPLHFRAIHDSRDEAERFITLQTHGEPYAITEYVPKSPEPAAGPLDVNRERVIEELLAKEGESTTLFVNILRNWSAEKIGRLAEQLALRGDKPPAGSAFEECVERLRKLYYDGWKPNLSFADAVRPILQEMLASAPIDLNATREEVEGWLKVEGATIPYGEQYLITFMNKDIGPYVTAAYFCDDKWCEQPYDHYLDHLIVLAYRTMPPAFVQGTGGKP